VQALEILEIYVMDIQIHEPYSLIMQERWYWLCEKEEYT
jgi:hypothetical protein